MVKDFRVLSSERMLAVSFFVGLAITALVASSLTIVGAGLAFFLVFSYTIYLFSIEEKYHAERFFASLAVKRRDLVIARYLNGLVIVAVFLALAYPVNAVLLRTGVPAGVPAAHPITIGYVSLILAAVAVSAAISLPAFFKLGFTKARVFITLIYIVPFVGGSFLMGISSTIGIDPSSTIFSMDPPASLLIAAGALVLWAASIPLAVRLYGSRDL
jgi:hypothetical protein